MRIIPFLTIFIIGTLTLMVFKIAAAITHLGKISKTLPQLMKLAL